jgi:hypothetical protein
MEFRYTEEQAMLRQSVREFAAREIRPHAREWDEAGAFHHAVLPGLREMGLLGILFPEQYGGTGMGYIEYSIILDELAQADPSVSLTVAAHNSLCSNHIYMFGNDAQKEKYLKPLASGEVLGAWALTEPGSGSDASGMLTTAKKVDGGWVLNGSKAFITHVNVGATAVVMAVSDPNDKKHGISAFIVELDAKGVGRGRKEDKMGMRSSDTGPLSLDEVFVPAENLLGQEGRGFQQAMEILDGGRISIASLSLGLARGAFEHAIKYAQQRKQFGQPIAELEGIQFYFADMATRIEAAALLIQKSAALKDAGRKVTLESSMAKYYAGEVATWVSERAVQILGGYGFIKEYPVEKYYRDVKLCTIGEGTSEIQKVVIFRQLQKLFPA